MDQSSGGQGKGYTPF